MRFILPCLGLFLIVSVSGAAEACNCPKEQLLKEYGTISVFGQRSPALALAVPFKRTGVVPPRQAVDAAVSDAGSPGAPMVGTLPVFPIFETTPRSNPGAFPESDLLLPISLAP